MFVSTSLSYEGDNIESFIDEEVILVYLQCKGMPDIVVLVTSHYDKRIEQHALIHCMDAEIDSQCTKAHSMLHIMHTPNAISYIKCTSTTTEQYVPAYCIVGR